MSLYEIDERRKAEKLLEVYKRGFKNLLGEEPVFDLNESIELLMALVRNVGYAKTKSLLMRYFQITDEWVRGQGYSLTWFKNNLNRVISMTGSVSKQETPLYVVFYSEIGRPVTSHNPLSMGIDCVFKAVPWEDWLKATVKEKLQLDISKWMSAGNDVQMWIQNWYEWGFLQRDVTPSISTSLRITEEVSV